jgi:hypothetical protein
MDIIILSDEDEGISMDSHHFIVIAIFIESDGNDLKAVADSNPRAVKSIPVILAIQRLPLVQTSSAKTIV